MGTIYSDQEIDALIKEQKPLPQNFISGIHFRRKLGHKEYDLDIKGENGNIFRIILRQNASTPLDFSVILGYLPVNTSIIFRLRRYNGKSHEHTNKIEKSKFYNFHVHKATERYQSIGEDEDKYAEPTDRFYDFYSALQCMLNDCGFITPEGSQLQLLQEKHSWLLRILNMIFIIKYALN